LKPVQTASNNKRISLVLWIFLLLNILAAVLLLTVYISAYINPAKFSWFAFAGLAYPVFLAINLLFILFWLVTRIRFSLLSFVAILIGWTHVEGLIQLRGSTDIGNTGNKIKVISYNIQNFLNQNISTTRYITDFGNQTKISRFLIDQKADIICLQEMLYDRGDHRDFAVGFGKKCGTSNFYYRNYYQDKKKKLDALAVFTKFPMIKTGYLEYDSKTICIYCDLIIEADTVRLYNLHLASIHFKKEDYEFIADIQSNTEQDEITKGSLKVISKLRTAFITRGKQTEILKEHFQKCPYPYIVCGDFNDSPTSYVYRNLSKGLTDGFVESGIGTGSTFAGKNFPALRIDYILHDDYFKGFDFKRQKNSLSDHYPVSCVLVPVRKP